MLFDNSGLPSAGEMQGKADPASHLPVPKEERTNPSLMSSAAEVASHRHVAAAVVDLYQGARWSGLRYNAIQIIDRVAGCDSRWERFARV
jgi:hypothetical protein